MIDTSEVDVMDDWMNGCMSECHSRIPALRKRRESDFVSHSRKRSASGIRHLHI